MLFYITILIILTASLLHLFNYFLRDRRKTELIDKIPGPYAWPIVGNIFELLVTPDELWKITRMLNKKYYPIHRLWCGQLPHVLIRHPDDVEVLLSSTKHIEKSFMYEFLKPWLSTGLLTSKGDKWHKRRKILTPAFHFKVLEQFVGTFIEQSEKLAQSLCSDVSEEVVPDLVSLLHKYTLHTICDTTMGFKDDMESKILNEYRSCVSEMGDITVYRLSRPWMHSNWLFRFFKKFKEQVRILKVLHGFSSDIINDRKRYYEENDTRYLEELNSESYSSHDLNEEAVEGKRRLAMLDLLISAEKREASIDDEGIREEVDTFIFEGHDTTAMGLCFTLMLLAENKEIQEKARAESDSIFGRKEKGEISIRELRSLYYLEQCIKESLRLFPSVPFIARQISGDLQLKNYLIPDGTFIGVDFHELHRDANFWPNPEVFDPDRFSPDQSHGRHPFAYLPFSAGPRNCIGQKFAMLELKALVGIFLHNFYLEPIDFSSEVQLRSDMIIRPIKPIRIKFVRRAHDDIQ